MDTEKGFRVESIHWLHDNCSLWVRVILILFECGERLSSSTVRLDRVEYERQNEQENNENN